MNADLQRAVQLNPGHMVRAMRKVGEYLKLVDLVVEVIDARAPRSDANPMLDALIGNRERLTILNRDDLADPATTKRWIEDFESRDRAVIAVEGRQQQSVGRILRAVNDLAK